MKIIAFLIFYFAVVFGNPISFVGPIIDTLRHTKFGINKTGVGVSHSANIVDNDFHHVETGVSISRNWNAKGILPDNLGGHLVYKNKPSGGTAFLDFDKTRDKYTDINTGVKLKILQGDNVGVDVIGNYGKRFGEPDIGNRNNEVFLKFNGTF